ICRYLDGNCVAALDGLDCARRLTELRLADQRLPVGAALELDTKSLRCIGDTLTALDVSGNNLRSLTPLAALSGLQRLGAARNDVDDLQEAMLEALEWLQELDLQHNPVCSTHKYYERAIARSNDRLETLDGKHVEPRHR
ncbi:unnamed protein product, partial [Phaeothamnion confervicola]